MEDQRVGTIINMRSNQGVNAVWCPPAEVCVLDNAREDSCLDGQYYQPEKRFHPICQSL